RSLRNVVTAYGTTRTRPNAGTCPLLARLGRRGTSAVADRLSYAVRSRFRSSRRARPRPSDMGRPISAVSLVVALACAKPPTVRVNIGDPAQSTYRLTAPACEICSLDQLQK